MISRHHNKSLVECYPTNLTVQGTAQYGQRFDQRLPGWWWIVSSNPSSNTNQEFLQVSHPPCLQLSDSSLLIPRNTLKHQHRPRKSIGSERGERIIWRITVFCGRDGTLHHQNIYIHLSNMYTYKSGKNQGIISPYIIARVVDPGYMKLWPIEPAKNFQATGVWEHTAHIQSNQLTFLRFSRAKHLGCYIDICTHWRHRKTLYIHM